jgi:phosphate-selective porin OprO/OprP
MFRRAGWLGVAVVAIATTTAGASDDAPPAAPPRALPVWTPDPAPPRAFPEWVPAAAPPEPPAPNPLAERLKQTIELRGRIDADAVLASQSNASKAQIGDLQNAYGFRRARLGAQGTVGTSSRWVAEVDFAGGDVRLRDTYVALTALPGVREVVVGYAREPFSLEGATSARFITFLERSPLNELDPTRNWGVTGYWWPDNERVLFATGFFRTNTTSGGLSIGDDDNWAVTTRLTGLPVYEDRDGPFRLVHVGGAFSHRLPPGGVVRYAPDAQSSLIDVSDNPVSPLLPRVDVPASSHQLYNLQAAAVYGPASVQGEWFGTAIQQRGAGVVFFHGFYADASYFLTGEHRGYNRQRAAFDRVNVLRPLVRTDGLHSAGCGAVELAVRLTVSDFDSANLPPPPAPVGAPTGTVLYQATFGANWYLNDYTRLMANYTVAVPAAPGLPALPVHVFGLRTAIWW